MRIAIDISPVSEKSISSHKVRGVGSYINSLIENLSKIDKKNKYFFVENKRFPKDVDLIHYPYFDPFFITLPFNSKKRFIVTVHDLTPLVFPKHFPAGFKGNLKWMIQRRLLNAASVVIADSKCSKNDIERIAGINKDRIKVVYLSAGENFKPITNTSTLQSTKVKYKLPDSFILYVGDVTWNKNLPGLIGAINNTDFHLVIVGKAFVNKDFDRKNVWNQDLALSQKLAFQNKNIIALGYVSDFDLAQIYNLATALIMPSFYEGFGLPILEAMQSGCPVITSDKGSLKEVGGEAVYYIDPYSTQSISEGIKQLMKNKALRDSLSEKGLIQAKKFSLERTVKDLARVYESV